MATAAVLAFGGATAGALAQDEPETPASTSVEQTPTSTVTTLPSTSDSAPPSTSTSESAPPSSTESAPVSTSESAPPPSAPEPPKSDKSGEAVVGGAYKIRAGHDANGNGGIDSGEEISGLKLSFLDKNSGTVVAERTTDGAGKAEFAGLPIGAYWVKAGGSWAFPNGLGVWDVYVADRDIDHTLHLVPGVTTPDVRGSLRFEKTSYESHEPVRFWMTLTNVGNGTAEQLKLDWLSGLELPLGALGDLSRDGAGIRLAAGQSRTVEAVGEVSSISDGKISLWGMVNYVGRPVQHLSYFSASVPVVQTKGEIGGLVYIDRNRNGQQDAGEATEGAVVEANGGAPYGYFKTTTDANGRFSFKDLPSGTYYVGYTLADGWIVHSDGQNSQIRVQPGTPVQLVARAERPYYEALSATLTLDKDVYQVGEKATITITLTNSGDRPLTEIQAWCNRIGDENQLGGRPGGADLSGWGDLIPPGKGVTVGAGETKTFIATEDVPQGAYAYGKVIASCGFAPHAGWNTDAAEARDTARVPGATGTLTGPLYYDRNGNWTVDAGEAIGNTRIVLRDREQNVDVAEVVSDDQGNVRFENVPVGDYWAWVDGPWQFEGEWGGHVAVFPGENRSGFPVVPGPAPDHGGGTTPAAPAGGAGAGSGSVDALAKTGASVLGLGLVGALLVAFGVGASVIGRRRQVA